MSHQPPTACGTTFSLKLLHPRYLLTWIGLGFAALLSLMPTLIRHGIGKRIGRLIYAKNNKRRTIVLTNLAIAFPNLNETEQQQLAKQHLQWYGCALVDYSLLLFGSKRRLAKMVRIEGQEHIEKAQDQNKSVMILLAHSVMLEFAPMALGLHYDCYGSYKQAKNPVIDWLISKGRCRYIQYAVSRQQGLRQLIRGLIPQQLLIFLPDEDLGKDNAVFAPFFGLSKATLTTTARIATLGKAVSLPCFAYYDENNAKYVIKISPAIGAYPTKDAETNAILLNQQLEALISQQPAQYLWLMKWYRTRPEGEAPLYP
ncbi:MAG: lysophospholipid acyltransferase family protein [Cocleimonas sp.]|nr:lysophospholipid acyltransferase family protein [Cocleimonas sp.]